MTEQINLNFGLTLFRPSAIEYPVKEDVVNPIEIKVFDNTLTDVFARFDRSLRKYSYNIKGVHSNIYSIFLFFADRQARLKKFYTQEPTYRLSLAQELEEADLTAKFTRDIVNYAPTDCIFFEWDNNFYVQPLEAVNGKEITLTANLGITVPVTAKCGFCFLSRFDQDNFDFNYLNDNIVESSISIIEVLHDFRES